MRKTAAGAGMGAAVRQERVGDTLVLVTGAGQTLDAGLRAALAAALAAVPGDVRRVVLLGDAGTFPGSPDAHDDAAPTLADLALQAEDLAVPVVVALDGAVTGGALELALAARGRVASAGARLGFADVRRGLAPCAGATQRLPRLTGAPAALDLLTTGRVLAASEALGLGMVDMVADCDALLETAMALAEVLSEAPQPRTRDRAVMASDMPGMAAAVASLRAQATVPAPGRIIDCVEAAMLLPFAQGLAFERAAFEDLRASSEAIALAHVAQAATRAVALPGRARAVDRVMVLGIGAAGLVMPLLQAGMAVTLADASAEVLVPELEAIARAGEAAVAAGDRTAADWDADWARLIPALSDDPPVASDMVIVGGAAVAGDGALPPVAAGRTEGAPVLCVGAAAPGVALGLLGHGRLAELLAGPQADPDAVATAAEVLRRIGRSVVVARGGGLVAPMAATLVAVARVLADSHDPAQVAGVLDRRGMVVDGLPAPAPQGSAARAIAPRILGALANAGLRLLGQGVALRPSDIDLALVHGLGWAAHATPPMLWAETRGPLVLRADLVQWARDDPDLWTPAPLLDGLIRDGLRLAALDAA